MIAEMMFGYVQSSMNFWEGFYFACFVAGLLLSVVSLIGGMGHISWHFHPPHVPHVPHMPHGVSTAGHAHPGAGAGAGNGSQGAPSAVTIPWWNAFSIMVFLCWFGASGYLMTRYGGMVASAVFVLSALCGLMGGAIIFWFLGKFLLPAERELTAMDTAVPGVVGMVSSGIRAGGTGEILYEQMGARRSAPARADHGEPIESGEEVYVVRYEHGIAYVRRWEESWPDGQS